VLGEGAGKARITARRRHQGYRARGGGKAGASGESKFSLVGERMTCLTVSVVVRALANGRHLSVGDAVIVNHEETAIIG